MNPAFADYERQREAFADLCRPQCGKRIRLFKGPHGTGKSSLMTSCLQRFASSIHTLPIQLRAQAVGVAEIFYRSQRKLGHQGPSHFQAQLRHLAPAVNIDQPKQEGTGNRIEVALNAESPDEREYRRAALTNAWFEDLEGLDKPMLMVLDTYEDASSEVQAWLSGPFLARAADNSRLRVALAGVEVPEPGIEWGHCCELHELLGVHEARHWLPVIEALGRQIPGANEDQRLGWLSGICYYSKGNPDQIMKILGSLPRKP